jgi:DNA-binding LacI/PurR family transcriptional regulator
VRGLSAFLKQCDGKCLVLLAQDLAHWPVGEVAAGANQAALAKGYRLISLDFHRSPERERELLQALSKSHVGGCIFLWDNSPRSLGLYEQLAAKFPCVQVIDPKPIPQLDSVVCDDYAGAMSAVRHLLLLGFREIGHVTVDTPMQAVQNRRQAYVDAMHLAELPINKNWLVELPYGVTDADRIVRKPKIREFLTQPNLPKALFVCADWLASEVIECIQDLGLSVPKDIALVGYDDALPYALTGIPFTTVQNDFREVGRLAVERVVFRLLNPIKDFEPCVIRITPRLVIRASSVRLSATMHRWEFIMRYIQDHFRENITVRQTASFHGLDPNYFSHHFKQIYGLRFTDAVNQLRLEYSTQLLQTTEYAIETIADSAGFRSPNHFYSLFKRRYGVTPHAYRKRQTFR